jgi:hypothetical protein
MVVPNKTFMLPSCSFKYIIQRNFAPLFTLTAAAFSILYFEIALSAIQRAVVIGLTQALFAVVFTRMLPTSVTTQKWWQLLFIPRPIVSLGTPLLALLGFTLAVVWQLLVVTGEVSVFTSFAYVSLGFAAGTSATWLLANLLLEPRTANARPHFVIEQEYIHIFAAAVVAAAFLGITLMNVSAFHTPRFAYAPVFVPLVYGIGSVCIALLPAYLTDNRSNHQGLLTLVAGFVAALLLMLLAQWLVETAFPASWVKNGKEYTADQLAQLWWIAIVSGYAAGSLEKIYQTAAKRYMDYLLNRPARRIAYNVFLHVSVNHVVAYLPTLLMIAALIYAYINGGIYGTALAVLGTVSNLGTGKVTVANSMLTEQVQYLTDGAKRKLRLLSPPMAALIRKSNKINTPEVV